MAARRAALSALVVVAGVVAAFASVRADEGRDKAALAASQSVIGRVVGDVAFVDSEGRPIRLAAYRGRPLLVNLVYTACSDRCPTIVQSLANAVEVAQDALGVDAFAVITVGFDSRNDTPARMRAFARAQGVALPNWDFLSADGAAVARLAADLGFTIEDVAAGGFAHLSQVSILDREGRVAAQIYGASFTAPALVEPLKDVVFGRARPLLSVAGLVDRVRLFCTLYNPNTGRYQFDYSFFLGLAIGAVVLIGVAVTLVREWCRSGPESGTEGSGRGA